MEPTPRLLKTYQEARLLFEAKGWALAKAAEQISELPEMARFHITHTKLSKKTTPAKQVPIEPEVAAAVEGLKTWVGHERQTEIVIAGLLALHSAPSSVELVQVATEVRDQLPASEPALKLVEALEQKAGHQRAPRLGRAFWTRTAISAGSGALVGCLALLVAPLLAGAAQPGPLMVMVFSPAGDDPRHLDPRSLLDMPANWGEKPLDQTIPTYTLPGQKAPPCDSGLREEAINAGCWQRTVGEPPCGRLFRHDNKCYRPIAAEPKKPAP